MTGSFADRLRVIRWQARRLWAATRYGRALSDSPVLFGNSFPKSGTHLLAQVLSAFPQIGVAVERGLGPILTYERGTGRKRSAAELLADLRSLKPGDLGFGHVTAEAEILAGWPQAGVAHLFMLRDPRDVVLSHAFYIGDKAVHNVHHEYYRSLPDLEARIKASILGRPDWEGDFPDVGQRFAPYLPWLDCPEVCVLHFEDFIHDRPAALRRLLDAALQRGFKLRASQEAALDALDRAINPQRSYTFRSGKVGEWRDHFTQEHRDLFKQVAGDLLVRLGYERDEAW